MNRSITVLALGALLFGCRGSTESAPAANTTEAGAAPAPSAAAAAASGAAATDEPPSPTSLLPPEAPFEGEVVLLVSEDASGKLPTKFAYDLKGDHVRMAGQGNIVRVLADLDAHKAYTVDQVNKVFHTVDLTSAGALPTIKKTGRKETVAAFECEDWTIDAVAEQVDACVAPGMAFFGFDPDLAPGRTATSWATALTAEHAFPLRAVVKDRAGRVKYHLEASKVFRAPVDSAIFSVPTAFAAGDLTKDERAIALP